VHQDQREPLWPPVLLWLPELLLLLVWLAAHLLPWVQKTWTQQN
jgi:hypothetical protein